MTYGYIRGVAFNYLQNWVGKINMSKNSTSLLEAAKKVLEWQFEVYQEQIGYAYFTNFLTPCQLEMYLAVKELDPKWNAAK